jgi:hypothetical protein
MGQDAVYFRQHQELIGKIFKSPDGIRDVSHFLRRVIALTRDAGANYYFYRKAAAIYYRVAGPYTVSEDFYEKEKSSYIKSAGVVGWPSFQNVVYGQLPNPWSSMKRAVDHQMVMRMLPLAMLL